MSHVYDIEAERSRINRVTAARNELLKSSRAAKLKKVSRVKWCSVFCRDEFLDLQQAGHEWPNWITDEGHEVEYLVGAILHSVCPNCRKPV